jgi:hypothetical protein
VDVEGSADGVHRMAHSYGDELVASKHTPWTRQERHAQQATGPFSKKRQRADEDDTDLELSLDSAAGFDVSGDKCGDGDSRQSWTCVDPLPHS